MSKTAPLIIASIILFTAGCAGYRIGSTSLYNQDIKTIHVPIFESESFRRNLGERMTEAVIKRIEERTCYKVVGRPSADSTLSGRIVSESQMVTAVNEYDDTRQKKFTMAVEVRWTDRRSGNDIRHFTVTTDSQLVAEMGQSLSTAQQQVIEDLADQIIGWMENPW